MPKILFLLLFVIICFVLLVAFSQSNKLTRDKIIKIAINKARDLGYKIEEMSIIYDEGNRSIKEHLMRTGVSTYNEKTKNWDKDLPTTPEKEYPELDGKDYQAVYIGPRKVMLSGDLWVFIDKNTGQIIKYVRGR